MKKWTERELIKNKFTIWNGKITDVDLSMADHGCITLGLAISGYGCCVVYGGYCLGHGYVGADEFDSTDKAMVYLMRIMDTIGVERFNDLKGKYVRVASEGWGSTVKIIGNIIDDNWFDAESFFEEAKND